MQGPLPQHLADRYEWKEFAACVYSTWQSVADASGVQPVIVTSNYGQAGALELFQRRDQRATVVSPHNQYWYWARPEEWGTSFLPVGFAENAVRLFFEETSTIGIFTCRWCRENAQPVVLAHKPCKAPEVLWARIRHFL